MMERLLERISVSKYKKNFILKGGFLIASIVGLDSRATMDLDATIKGIKLTHESIKVIFERICQIEIEDDVSFSIVNITDIREKDDYLGIRISIIASYPPLKVPIKVDITTGDIITPHEIEYNFKLLFDEHSIAIVAYNLETILAEKLETVLSRNIANTRPRDFYDIYNIYTLNRLEINLNILQNALYETTKKRGSLVVLSQYKDIVDKIKKSTRMHDFWIRYQKEFDYAKDILFEDTCNIIFQIMNRAVQSK